MLDIVDIVEVVESDDTVASSVQFLERFCYDSFTSFRHGRLEEKWINKNQYKSNNRKQTNPNCFEELVDANRSRTVCIEGVEESTTSVIIYFDSTFIDAFTEFFETQRAIAIIIHPAEYSIFYLHKR